MFYIFIRVLRVWVIFISARVSDMTFRRRENKRLPHFFCLWAQKRGVISGICLLPMEDPAVAKRDLPLGLLALPVRGLREGARLAVEGARLAVERADTAATRAW